MSSSFCNKKKQTLHVGQMNLPPWEQFVDIFEDIFERQYYANNGPLVRKLDNELAQFLGVKHVVTMTNGTVALMIAAKALGLQGEIILPAFTFVATAQAMNWSGLDVVFCDVDPLTHTITPDRVESLITNNTSAILGVHLWGRPCDIEGLVDLSDKYSLQLMFDAAHAFGVSHFGKMIGNFGDVEIFSLHATKICNALEGGFAATNNDEIAARLRTIRNFHQTETLAEVPLRINGKMSEAQAAFGLLSLEHLSEYIQENKKRYLLYKKELTKVPGISVVEYDMNEKNNYQYVIAQVNQASSGISRDEFVRKLESQNILARRYFTPGIHKTSPYRKRYPQFIDALPVTDKLSKELMQLPNGQNVTHADVKRICSIIHHIQQSSASNED